MDHEALSVGNPALSLHTSKYLTSFLFKFSHWLKVLQRWDCVHIVVNITFLFSVSLNQLTAEADHSKACVWFNMSFCELNKRPEKASDMCVCVCV